MNKSSTRINDIRSLFGPTGVCAITCTRYQWGGRETTGGRRRTSISRVTKYRAVRTKRVSSAENLDSLARARLSRAIISPSVTWILTAVEVLRSRSPRATPTPHRRGLSYFVRERIPRVKRRNNGLYSSERSARENKTPVANTIMHSGLIVLGVPPPRQGARGGTGTGEMDALTRVARNQPAGRTSAQST